MKLVFFLIFNFEDKQINKRKQNKGILTSNTTIGITKLQNKASEKHVCVCNVYV